MCFVIVVIEGAEPTAGARENSGGDGLGNNLYIIIGVGAAFLLLLFSGLFLAYRSKKKREEGTYSNTYSMGNYGDTGSMASNNYGSNASRGSIDTYQSST